MSLSGTEPLHLSSDLAIDRTRRLQGSIPWLLLTPALVLLTLVGFWPLLYSLWISFQGYAPTNPDRYQGFVGLDNYTTALTSAQLWSSTAKTIIFTVISTLISAGFGLGLAFLFRMELPGFKLLRVILLIPMLVTPIAVGIMWRVMFLPQGGILNYLLNSVGLPSLQWTGTPEGALASLILMDVWQWTPFMFLILYASLQALPRSPFEAAQIDGATQLQIFFHIYLPLLKPMLLLAVLLRGIDASRTYDQIYIATRGGPNFATDTLPIYLQRVTFRFFEIGYGAAVSWIFLFMLLAAVIVFIRYTGFLRDMLNREEGR